MTASGRAVAVLWLMCAGVPAFAADPAPEVSVEDGVIVGRLVVDADADAVRALVADPVQCGRLSPEVVTVTSQRSGPCDEVTTETRGAWRPLRFLSRRCPTADGWREELVQSDDFRAYESSWELRAVDGGTEVVLKVKSDVNLPVPESLVQSRTRKSVGEILVNLALRAVGK